MDGSGRGQHDMERSVTGRPSSFTQDVADTICARIAEGESLRRICRGDDMPSLQTVMNWLAKNGDFVEQYARAREAQQDAFADEILDIADDGTNDWMEKHSKDGESIGWVVNGEAVQRSRLRVESRKWLMSKLAPKKYGEKITADLNHGAQDSLAELMKVIDGRSRGLPG